MDWFTEEILVIVKAYPTPSEKYGETVCTAGITRGGKWIRLYPVQYRDLPPDKQFKKFQWIRAKIKSATEKFNRPESHKINIESLVLLDIIKHGTGWKTREKIFLPLVSKSLEELEEMKKNRKITLGAFKPKEVRDFVIKRTDERWADKKQSIIFQGSLLKKNKTPLEKIPCIFSYQFSCNDPRCKGNHDIIIVDWEMGESYRKFKQIYKTDELTQQKLKEKWLDYFFRKRESYFVVGTDSFWNKFMILTVVSPRRAENQMSFEFG